MSAQRVTGLDLVICRLQGEKGETCYGQSSPWKG